MIGLVIAGMVIGGTIGVGGTLIRMNAKAEKANNEFKKLDEDLAKREQKLMEELKEEKERYDRLTAEVEENLKKLKRIKG